MADTAHGLFRSAGRTATGEGAHGRSWCLWDLDAERVHYLKGTALSHQLEAGVVADGVLQ